jgi:hypothetical protein
MQVAVKIIAACCLQPASCNLLKVCDKNWNLMRPDDIGDITFFEQRRDLASAKSTGN